MVLVVISVKIWQHILVQPRTQCFFLPLFHGLYRPNELSKHEIVVQQEKTFATLLWISLHPFVFPKGSSSRMGASRYYNMQYCQSE